MKLRVVKSLMILWVLGLNPSIFGLKIDVFNNLDERILLTAKAKEKDCIVPMPQFPIPSKQTTIFFSTVTKCCLKTIDVDDTNGSKIATIKFSGQSGCNDYKPLNITYGKTTDEIAVLGPDMLQIKDVKVEMSKERTKKIKAASKEAKKIEEEQKKLAKLTLITELPGYKIWRGADNAEDKIKGLDGIEQTVFEAIEKGKNKELIKQYEAFLKLERTKQIKEEYTKRFEKAKKEAAKKAKESKEPFAEEDLRKMQVTIDGKTVPVFDIINKEVIAANEPNQLSKIQQLDWHSGDKITEPFQRGEVVLIKRTNGSYTYGIIRGPANSEGKWTVQTDPQSSKPNVTKELIFTKDIPLMAK